ncbi:Ras GTPase-activating protein 1 [Clonorchis sinensis]|uniref:Ras GTPase-activating protein 1 n=1 Tax=Clonorchis sinensis TaxID=79923 RepID=A0A419PC99_CLOSI|nr:Ras GTPase-activating protein 1 [Clonorchis sinensis]
MPRIPERDSPELLKAPALEQYYHGFIDRTEAERRLKACNIPNSYLLRLSLSRPDNDQCDTIYVLSYLSSALDCHHFKLIPRLNCFQLGGRLFDCLQGCLSRYYVHYIIPGERLRHPVAPCSPPFEYHTQRLRAVQTFEPENANDRLGCSVGDRFLLVSEDPNTDWVFATSLKTRHSGYLPKCCVEKEYPELIERLEFFHPDTTSAQLKDLLKKAGAYSYLLRPCASRVGLYTLLLYDGARVRKYRLELVVQSEECTPHHLLQPNGQRPDSAGDGVHRRSSEPAGRSVYIPDGETHPVIQMEDIALEVPRRRSDGIVAATGRDTSDPVNATVANAPDVPTANDLYREPVAAGDLVALPRYRATTVVVYNGFTFPSVEAVVAAIEAHPGPWHPDVPSATVHTNGDTPDIARSCEADCEVARHLAGDGTAPHVFKPVRREQKPQMNPPSSAIYMALRYTRQPAQLAVLEIHGEMSMMTTQRKKWKPYYAQLDRRQGILTLWGGEKRKTERFNLADCDFFPVHPLMYDRPFCFGLILYGASLGDREELIFSIDPPSFSCAICRTTSGLITVAPSNRSVLPSANYDWEPSTYAARPEDAVYSAPSSVASGSCPRLSPSNSVSAENSAPGFPCSHAPPASMETIFQRWLRCVRLHCCNTRVDAANEEDLGRRQTHLRIYRTLEVKINNAKLLALSSSKPRRDESVYSVLLDGIEIARAYTGSSPATIFLDDFPFGFKKVEVLCKEEKRRRPVAMDIELAQFNSELSTNSEPRFTVTSTTGNCGHSQSHTDQNARRMSGSARGSGSSICAVRERCSSQGTIVYRELHILPFPYYERFREVLRSSLDTELIPLCIYVWKNLPHDASKLNFVTSLLRTTTELKCHLQLLVNLLKTDIIQENPSHSFRGNTLGAQILDLYCNQICSKWRNQCLRRVREEALNGPPAPPNLTTMASFTAGLCPSSVSTTTTTTTTTTITTNSATVLGRASVNVATSNLRTTAYSYPCGVTRPCSLSASACTSTSVTSIEPVQTDLHTCVDKNPRTSPQQQQPTVEQEWHSRLISIAVDDLISHVHTFPLQVRWIYSELQALYSDPHSNLVGCNLVFLRGICPCLSSPPNSGRGSLSGSLSGGVLNSSTGGCYSALNTSNANLSESNGAVFQDWVYRAGQGSTVPAATGDALVVVAKTLLALVSPNVAAKSKADSVLTQDQFMAYHTRLIREFRTPITTPLSAAEIKQLEQLCEREAYRASYWSLSRELAQLANYFLDALGNPRPGSETGSHSTVSDHKSGDSYSPPRAPTLLAVLYDLDELTQQYLSSTESVPRN